MGICLSSPLPEELPREDTTNFIDLTPMEPLSPVSKRIPIALCYSYQGTGYSGLQRTPENSAVENVLFDALDQLRLIPPESERNFGKMRWHQASRTDAGVHAAAQILTFHADVPANWSLRDIPSKINAVLPANSNIHMWSAITIHDTFSSQRYASARRYFYLLPTSAFKSRSRSHLKALRETAMKEFVGALNYHNYTRQMPATDPSAHRSIMEFTFSEPFLIDGSEFVLFKIYGKSFMLNQIRKMIGVVLSFSHGQMTAADIRDTFTHHRWSLPKIPGDGLLLDKVEFSGFLNKYKNVRNNPKSDVEFTHIRPLIENWKREFLFPNIGRKMVAEDIFGNYIRDVLLVFPPHRFELQ